MNTLEALQVTQGMSVLVRADFNVPIVNNQVMDTLRIDRSLPTLAHLQEQGAVVVVVAHLGRPKGARVAHLSLRPVYDILKKKLDKVIFEPNLEINAIQKTIQKADLGSIILLENIRFLKEEEQQDTPYEEHFADLFDAFVLDGFGVVHRQGMTITEMPGYMPSYAGQNLSNELDRIQEIVGHNVGLIIGGAKTKTKLPVIETVVDKAAYVFVGGVVANSYLYAKKYKIGDSAFEPAITKRQLNMLQKKFVHLPQDYVVQDTAGGYRIVDVDANLKQICKKGEKILDIGPKTIKHYLSLLHTSSTIIWNGPLGYVEKPPFHIGTLAMADAILEQANQGRNVLIGGGETAQFFRNKSIPNTMFISTGGGAMLAYLSGKPLPGIVAITDD